MIHKPQLTSLVTVNGNICPRFEQTLIPMIESIDRRFTILLDGNSHGIILTPTVVNHLPHLKNQQPRGWPKGKTWHHADGCFSHGKNEAIVAQGNLDKSGKLIESDRWGGVLFHELGHSIDKAMGFFSRSMPFIHAYISDLARIINNPVEKKLGYYMQGFDLKKKSKLGPAGLSEAFAEVTAALFGIAGIPKHTRMILRVFRNTARLLRQTFLELPATRLAI